MLSLAMAKSSATSTPVMPIAKAFLGVLPTSFSSLYLRIEWTAKSTPRDIILIGTIRSITSPLLIQISAEKPLTHIIRIPKPIPVSDVAQ